MPPPSKKQLSRGKGSQYSQKIDPVTIHIAYEGEKVEKEYFDALSNSISRRFKNLLILFPVPKSAQGSSSPEKVVDDLVVHLNSKRIKLNRSRDHVGFVVIDTDHHFTGAHNRKTQEALRVCKQKGIEVAITNPCFEIWQMCHFDDISRKDDDFKKMLLENKKHPDSKSSTFSKVEYSKMKGNTPMKEIIGLIRIALENEGKINDELQDKTTLYPSVGLYSGVGQVIKKMEASGFFL